MVCSRSEKGRDKSEYDMRGRASVMKRLRLRDDGMRTRQGQRKKPLPSCKLPWVFTRERRAEVAECKSLAESE
eukprot:756068-Hanusia_phi.AAC.1